EGDRQIEDEDDEDVLEGFAEDGIVEDLFEVREADEVVDAEAVPIVEGLLEHEDRGPVLEEREQDEGGKEEGVHEAHAPDALPDIRRAAIRDSGARAGRREV